MRKFFAIAMGSLVALAGFAGTANASATVDLIWIDVSTTDTAGNPVCLKAAKRNCPQLGTTTSSVAASDEIALLVQVTAGPEGMVGGSVSVDYGELMSTFSVSGFQSFLTTKPGFYWPAGLGVATNIPPLIDGLNATALPFLTPSVGLGLPAGSTAYLGTVTFHEDILNNGTFNLDVGAFGPFDALGDLGYNDITSTTTFNPAAVVNVPEPGALSLLVMGLGGMLLAGRGRK
jgi:hypothetical protein